MLMYFIGVTTAQSSIHKIFPRWAVVAGGAGVALAACLCRNHQPTDVILTDVSAARLDQVRPLTRARCVLVNGTEEQDALLANIPPGSLIVNATGMGKDRPGSPVSAR